MAAQIIPVEPFAFVVFGGAGEPSRLGLLPALHYRMRAGQLPAEARIGGASRRGAA